MIRRLLGGSCASATRRRRSRRRGGGAPGSRPAEQLVDRAVARLERRPHLAPRAVARILVLAEADQARAVPETVALHLVVAHLDYELRPDGRLLELAAAPAVRLGEAAVGCALEQRLHELQDLRRAV